MPPPAPPAIGRSSQVLAVVLLGIQAALLAKALAAGDWILDVGGRPLFTDFSTIWVTGLQIRHEPAVAAYDWARHGAWERGWFATEGLPSGWHYAPSLLFVVWALALLPFPLAFAGWVASTGALYALAVQGIVRHRAAGVLALAFPAVTWNAMVGQTGTLTAALIGAALGLLERRPVWAGIALGCLTYKPQFGLLFPLALAAGGHWRATAAAAATAAGLIAASALAFGPQTWLAFAANIPALQSAVLEQNLNGAHKLQSVFGLLRFLGAAPGIAYAVHAASLALVAGSVIALWRSRAPFDLKAAWLALATVLATPYAFVYDLPVLAVAIAFMVRLALTRGIAPWDVPVVAAACLLIQAFPVVRGPSGLAAILLLAGWVAHRWRAFARPTVQAGAFEPACAEAGAGPDRARGGVGRL
jgi:arabinofuranan 3-O-arabinosyltransferase